MLASLALVCLAQLGPQGSSTPAASPRLPWGWNDTLLGSTQPAPVGQFAVALALDEDTLVVGASHEPQGLPYVGSASVFRRVADAWVEEARLEHPTPSAGAVFGSAVALDGERIAVGAPFDDVAGYNAGAVHVYARSGARWELEATLTGADSAPDDHFGIALALAGDVLLVGAHGHDGAGLDAGAAYLFQAGSAGWRQTRRLVPGPGSEGARFGDLVDLDARRAVVAAPYASDQGPDAGAVHVYRLADGGLEAKLFVEGASDLYFGASVAIEGDRLAVGATGDGFAGPFAGAVHLYEREAGSWKETAVVRGHDTQALDRFGHSVSLVNGRLAVGAHRNGGWAPQAGAAYLFGIAATGFSELAVLRPPQLEAGDLFGYALSLDGGALAVGAPLTDSFAYDAGAAWVFTLP